MIEKECAYCHKKYYISDKAKKRLKYCSQECRIAGHDKSGYSVVCPICGTEFHTTPSVNAKYCSKACYGKAQQTQEHIEFRKSLLKERYGVESVGYLPEVQEKKKNTSLKNFGVEHPSQSDIVKEKHIKTNIIRYGVEHTSKLESVIQKRRDTNQKRYGCEEVLASTELRNKNKQTLFDAEGIYYTSQRVFSALAKSVLLDKTSFLEFINKHEDKSAVLLYTELGVDCSTFYSYVDKYNARDLITHTTSRYEKEIMDLFPMIPFKKDRTILDGKEIDLYSESHKLGIEFNGGYWHSDAKKGKYYHRDKSALAASKGVFIFHIFEWEWLNPITKQAILSRLTNIFKHNIVKIFARKCTLLNLNGREAGEFYKTNHVQGKCPADVHIGLKCGELLVSVMSFKKNGINKNHEWELCRFACKKGCSVVGGASRLFKHFVLTYTPTSVISYSDIAKTSGKIYETLGFTKAHITHPQYWWVKNGTIVYTRYQTQLKQLIKRGLKQPDDGKTEEQIMREHGFYKLYDCGKIAWVYRGDNMLHKVGEITQISVVNTEENDEKPEKEETK